MTHESQRNGDPANIVVEGFHRGVHDDFAFGPDGVQVSFHVNNEGRSGEVVAHNDNTVITAVERKPTAVLDLLKTAQRLGLSVKAVLGIEVNGKKSVSSIAEIVGVNKKAVSDLLRRPKRKIRSLERLSA